MHKIKLLLVEDECTLGRVIKDTLEQQGFDIVHSVNGVDGWNAFKSFKPEICVVDIMMPKKDGLSLLMDIRMVNQQVPVIFLTAKSQTEDVIAGLKTGADDYIKKPFSMEELLLRIRSLLKRSTLSQPEISKEEPKRKEISIGAYLLYCQKNELVYNKTVTKLSQRESDLLTMLALSTNEVVLRKDVLLKLWGEDNFFNARNMDVYISKLRKYLEKDPAVEIINVRGVGFKLIM